MAAAAQEGERRRDPSFYGYVWQGAQYEGLVCDFLEAAASAGGGLPVRQDGGIEVDTGPNRKALDMLRSLIQEDLSPPETYAGMKEEEARLYFDRGSALFERNWPYAWSLHQRKDSPVRGRVGLSPLPHFPGGRSAAALGGWEVGISGFSKDRAAAAKLVRYLVSIPVQRRLALELGWNPGRREMYTDSALLSELPHFRELGEVFAHAVPRPNLPYWTRLSEALQRHLNAALSGKEGAAEALAAAQAETDAVAAQYRER
jgi:multiple sugar transport system substrate-binding protein